jgi:glycosyltransferase involved in cell wall biosynthesis
MKTSVLISNYNYAPFLAHAIESVLAQSVPAHEIIVVDDGSTDHSRDVMLSYGQRIISLYQNNAGQAAAISAGYARATGDIIMLLDADDLFHPHKIEIMQHIYEIHPTTDWIFHDLKAQHVEKVIMENIPISSDITPVMIDQRASMGRGTLKYDAPATSGLTFRKEFMKDFFPMPRASSITLSDHYIKFYCLAVSSGFHIPEPLGIQVIHDSNLYTGRQSQKALATRARIFANTAIYLREIAPHSEKFCRNMAAEALSCSLKSSIYKEISQMLSSYLAELTFFDKFYILAKAFAKKLLNR